MEETYLSAYVFKNALEKAIDMHGVTDVTPRKIRDAAAGVKVEADVSPEGLVWIDGDNFNTWLKPKIGQCQADGSFKVIKEAADHVAPDPFSIYPDSGKCTADGLLGLDGKLKVDLI